MNGGWSATWRLTHGRALAPQNVSDYRIRSTRRQLSHFEVPKACNTIALSNTFERADKPLLYSGDHNRVRQQPDFEGRVSLKVCR